MSGLDMVMRSFRWLGMAALGALVLVLAARRALLFVTVTGESMAPTYQPGDRLLVVRRRFRRMIRTGDVVVCHSPRPAFGNAKQAAAVEHPKSSWLLVKRVAAMPGEPLPYRQEADSDELVPTATVYLLGDNTASWDSRAFGPLPQDHVVGVVLTRLWAGEAPQRLLDVRNSDSGIVFRDDSSSR